MLLWRVNLIINVALMCHSPSLVYMQLGEEGCSNKTHVQYTPSAVVPTDTSLLSLIFHYCKYYGNTPQWSPRMSTGVVHKVADPWGSQHCLIHVQQTSNSLNLWVKVKLYKYISIPLSRPHARNDKSAKFQHCNSTLWIVGYHLT
jgi:hypothetical protein